MKCKECNRSLGGGYKGFCKKCYWKNYYKNHKERYSNYIKKYQQSKNGRLKIKEYVQKNKEKLKGYRRIYERKRRKEESFRLRKIMRNRLRRVVVKYSKTGRIYHPLLQFFKEKDDFPLTEYQKIFVGLEGIDYEGIIEKLKPLPKSLKNYQIDHIIPLKKFNFNDPKQIRKAFLPENIQLLTIKEHRKKGD